MRNDGIARYLIPVVLLLVVVTVTGKEVLPWSLALLASFLIGVFIIGGGAFIMLYIEFGKKLYNLLIAIFFFMVALGLTIYSFIVLDAIKSFQFPI